MSQQFHAWGHMKKSELPKPIITLQVGILLGFARLLSACCTRHASFAQKAHSPSCQKQRLLSEMSGIL